MALIQHIKRCVENTPWLLEVKFALLRPMHLVSYLVKQNANEKRIVREAARVVMASPEYPYIRKHPDAGRIIGRLLVMHDGSRVLPTCYLGWANSVMLQGTRGVHEPEEERVFQDVLQTLPAGATMLELGAYWAFYSLWFQGVVPDARSYLVEPELSHINYGKKNFRINKRKGVFTHALVGAKPGIHGDRRVISVDSFLEEHGIEMLDILHADIQGFELDMLRGASKAVEAGRIRWAFISTHSESLHRDCREFLLRRGFAVVADAAQGQIAGPDGVLVMRHETVPDPGIPSIRVALPASTASP